MRFVNYKFFKLFFLFFSYALKNGHGRYWGWNGRRPSSNTLASAINRADK